MKISYKKLWKLLIDKNMCKADLRKQAKISTGTMTKLRRNEAVAMEILMKICITCHCDVGDVMEFIPEPSDNESIGVIK